MQVQNKWWNQDSPEEPEHKYKTWIGNKAKRRGKENVARSKNKKEEKHTWVCWDEKSINKT